MVWASTLGLPRSLSDVGAILGLNKQKMTEGKELIKFFCTIQKDGTFNEPKDHPDKWSIFTAYNKRDVEVEMQIRQRLRHYPLSDDLWEEFYQSEEINDRGVLLDIVLVNNALMMAEKANAEMSERMKRLTNLKNPNSVVQTKEWLSRHGLSIDSLSKKMLHRH